MRPILLTVFAVLFVAVVPDATAQNNRWQAFPSLRNVQAVSASSDALWAGTEGGVFRYALASGEIERFTPVQGLSRVDVQALVYDEARDAVWIGYIDGVIDRLDVASGEVRPFFDIAQADRFNTRSINRIEVVADSLLISTGFGVVVFDAVRNEVSDTYERFSTLPAGTTVEDVLIAPLPDGTPGLWVGSRAGVAYAPLDSPNLREPSAWTIDAEAPDDVLSLAYVGESLFAGVERTDEEDGDVRRRTGGGAWFRQFYGNESFPDLLAADGELVALSVFNIVVRDADGTSARYSIDEVFSMRSAVIGANGLLWVGDLNEGLLGFPDFEGVEPGSVPPDTQVIPDGPLVNDIQALDVASDGTVWTGFQPPFVGINGFERFDGTTWTSYPQDEDGLNRSPVVVVHADASGNQWFGAEGTGLFQVTPEGEVVRYTPENSTLESSNEPGDAFYVVPGVDTDEEGRLWVTNRFASPPLHVRTPEGEWHGIARPNEISSGITYDELYIDSFGQKWLTARFTQTSGGAGIIVLDTSADPLDAADDRAAFVRSVGSVGTGLPDIQVNAIVEDRSGRMWLGTERGLATVFSPGSAFAGDLASQITWARTPDGASFFLRDLRIFDIAVDPADRKWLASNSGAWLINAEGTEVIANLTTENSPLPSDVIVAVTVDEEDGTVYFATSGGLYRYRGDAVAASPTAEDLFVYPNPVRGNGGALPEIAIEGLVDDADVRVLTVDGQVVASFQTRGGSVRWDGRDQRTGDFVSSGVYIVAAAGEDGEGTAYGKIAVIR